MTPPQPPEASLGVQPLSGHIGAEIHGVDLAAGSDRRTIEAIHEALLRWKVVFFRGQSLGPEGLVTFGECFGVVTPAHPNAPSLDGHPKVLQVDNAADKPSPDNTVDVRYESRWHTDVSYVDNPPLGSILEAVVVPPYGGDTQWVNLVTAYERLSPAVRGFIDQLRAVHVNHFHLEAATCETSPLAERFRATPYRAEHPVVRVHPETGERALFVNPNFTDHVVGVSRRESDAILSLLYDHLSQPEFTVRFHWEPGSLAFWDNRATAHLAPTDIRHLDVDRVMNRVTIAGDVPVGVDGVRSNMVTV